MNILNKNEKTDQVIKLYLERKTIREIAKIAHMSLSDIGKIIKDYEDWKARVGPTGASYISEETKAIDLFSQGKTPIEVKIELNIITEEVEKYYKAYWKLIGLYQLCLYYETELSNDLPSFLELYSKVKELGIQDEEVIIALSHIRDISYLELKRIFLENEIKELVIRIKHLKSKLNELELSINKFKNSFG